MKMDISLSILVAFVIFYGMIKEIHCGIQQRLVHDLTELNERRLKPTRNSDDSVPVILRFDLYQILEVNEPKQYVTLNTWIGETWEDELLYWNAEEYDNITELTLPYDFVWLPDTMLYNSIVMDDTNVRRLLNAKLKVNKLRRSVIVNLLYPTIFTFSCGLKVAYFPFDRQMCSLVIGSWTHDITGIDYYPINGSVGLTSYLDNEGWNLLHFTGIRLLRECPTVSQAVSGERLVQNFTEFPNPWVLLQYTIVLQRKPLFYIANLVIPTVIITFIAIVGFFMPSSGDGERREKITLGITTLLSMSILLMMVSDAMPTTSDSIPLIDWFFLAMILLVASGSFVSSVNIVIQRKGEFGYRLAPKTIIWTRAASNLVWVRTPEHLERFVQRHRAQKRSEAFSSVFISEMTGFVFVPDKNFYVDSEGELQKLSGKRQKLFEENRMLARTEYDWLVSVIERIAMIIFFILLFLSTSVILGIGLAHSMA